MSIRIVSGRLGPQDLGPPRLARLQSFLAVSFAPVLLLASPHIAVAADLPMKASSAPVYNWTGCYIGANLGGAASGTDFTSSVGSGTHFAADGSVDLVSTAGTGSANDSSYIVGGQTGCNWQTGTLVLGFEGDFSYFHSHPGFDNNTALTGNTLVDGSPFEVRQVLTTDYLATVRPRIGVAADRSLAYITAGAAFTHANYQQTYSDLPNGMGSTISLAPGAGSVSVSKSLVGWVAGAGWEYAWSDHWTFKLEYLFASFPTTSGFGAITDATPASNALHGSANLTIQTARAGVNFKF